MGVSSTDHAHPVQSTGAGSFKTVFQRNWQEENTNWHWQSPSWNQLDVDQGKALLCGQLPEIKIAAMLKIVGHLQAPCCFDAQLNLLLGHHLIVASTSR